MNEDIADTMVRIAMDAIRNSYVNHDGIAIVADIEGFYVPDENTYEFLKEMEVPEIVFADLDGNVKMMSLEEVEPYHPRRRD